MHQSFLRLSYKPQKDKSKSTRLKFAKYHLNCILSCLRLMSRLFIEEILRTIKESKSTVDVDNNGQHTQRQSGYLISYLVSGIWCPAHCEWKWPYWYRYIWRTDAFSMRYRFIFLAITHTASAGLRGGAMHRIGLVMIITRFRHCLWKFIMKYGNCDINFTLICTIQGFRFHYA